MGGLLPGLVVAFVTAVLVACSNAAAPLAPTATPPGAAAPVTIDAEAATATPTPGITARPPGCDGTATVSATEGPYYKPGSPERTVLFQPGMIGTKLTITGFVFSLDCMPVGGAWLDFWQADAGGAYDNSGYTLRGHQTTDATGRYTLVTVIPGQYPGRTPHIHVKVQAPEGRVLTTQLYLPDQGSNTRDPIFNPATVVTGVRDAGEGKTATFDFVVPR